MVPLSISTAQAREFCLRATGLRQPFPSLSVALDHLGYVQLDPLNVCGRMQDLILRNRLSGYTPGDLLRHIHGVTTGKREGFEHYIPERGVLAAWPLSAAPYIRRHLDQRGKNLEPARRLTPDEREIADHVIAEIEKRGPLRSDDFEHDARGITAWGTPGRLLKIVLEKLFAAGEVLISGRSDFRRSYDLPARVLGLLATAPMPSEEEATAWLARTRLYQHRLVRLSRAEIPLVEADTAPVSVDGNFTAYCLRQDVDLLHACAESAISPEHPLFLAPLDPVIYDRKLTSRLWGFDYIWEVYTPLEKRTRGYYSLPVLHGTEIVGDVEPVADWKKRTLRLQSRRIRSGITTKEAMKELARFLGLRPPR